MKFKIIGNRILIILFIINLVFLPVTNAAGTIISDGDSFLQKGNSVSSVLNETQLSNTSSAIYKTLLTIAICVSVIVGAVLGIQFILASAEGKAKISEALLPYIVGCFVVFGAFGIWSLVLNIGQSL